MERDYWIHRISHIAEISYPLLENNYLSYGFSDFEEERKKLMLQKLRHSFDL